jgi:HPt (histidine-containing phosphotransfer) domain-containing protein
MLNYDYLNEITGGDAEFIAELLGDFVSQTPALMEQITTALAQGDAATVGKVAHALKGSARAIGADELAAIAFELEQAGKQGDLTERARRPPTPANLLAIAGGVPAGTDCGGVGLLPL